jgi:hypothetical protein
VFSIADPDPDWWTVNINSEFVSSGVHQECRIALASVSLEPPSAIGTDSRSAVFESTFQPSGFSQQSFDFNVSANFDLDFEQGASQAYPDFASCMVAQNSTSPVQSDWNSMPSSSTQHLDCDFYSTISSLSAPPGNETLCQGSQANGKSRISVFHPFNCPHCSNPFSSERGLRHHIQNSHKRFRHPNICDDCGRSFTLPKDLKRHLKILSCRKGSAPTRLFACQCGKTYSRKDHLLRHINAKIRRPEDDIHLAV